MKTHNKIIASVLIISLLLILGCSKEETSLPTCDNSPQDSECICPDGLEKVSSADSYLYFCVNISCGDTVYPNSLNSTCVKSCPSEYANLFGYDMTQQGKYPYPLCFWIQNASDMACARFPEFHQCACPEGLTRGDTSMGYSCFNITCEGFLLSNGSCVEKCPEGLTYDLIVDVGPYAPLCVPEWYDSLERYQEEIKCEDDSDCVWDEYNSFECCKCGLGYMNIKTKEQNRIWREENCAGEQNYSGWKWVNCPNNPGNEAKGCSRRDGYLNLTEAVPLTCENGRCLVDS